MTLWRAAADLIRAGQSGALTTIARARGSTPVPAGTKMLVGAQGRLIGTVGGGCVEADVIGAALDAQAHKRPALLTQHLNADLAGDLGLSCGGTVDIFVEPLIEDDAYLLESVRYVLLNPVRSAGVTRPEHWRCSSARATLGLDPAPAWLDVDFVLGYFGATPERARARFYAFLLEGIGRPLTVPGTEVKVPN